MLDLGKFNILGVNVNAIDYQAATQRVVRAAMDQRGLSVTALAVHGVMSGVCDRQHQYRLNQFDLVCPDGQPVRWALNCLYGCQLIDRVYGPNLTIEICQSAAEAKLPIYLFGATDDMLIALRENLMERFPSLEIAGMRASRFRHLSTTERDALVQEIRESGAKICFVGLGCPRQEVFAYEMRDRLKMPVIAVGAAFAFHAGVLQQAPAWVQKYGLEWAFRLTREPRRLWKCYATTNPAFAVLLCLQWLGVHTRGDNQGLRPSEEVLFG